MHVDDWSTLLHGYGFDERNVVHVHGGCDERGWGFGCIDGEFGCDAEDGSGCSDWGEWCSGERVGCGVVVGAWF